MVFSARMSACHPKLRHFLGHVDFALNAPGPQSGARHRRWGLPPLTTPTSGGAAAGGALAGLAAAVPAQWQPLATNLNTAFSRLGTLNPVRCGGGCWAGGGQPAPFFPSQ